MEITYHALCLAILLALFLGFQWGKHADTRRRARERRRIWKEEQDKLPKAIRSIIILVLGLNLLACSKTIPGKKRSTVPCTCLPRQVKEDSAADFDAMAFGRG